MRAVGRRLHLRAALELALVWLASPFAAALRRGTRENAAHDAFARHGFHLLRKHYNVPIPDEEDLNDLRRRPASSLVGVDLNEAGALELTRTVLPPYNEEFRARFPLVSSADSRRFHLVNGGFMAGDAHVYYALIRHYRPRRIVEIGGGHSTLLAAAACLQNRAEGNPCHLAVIDPFPTPVLQAGFPGLDELVPQKVQQVELDRFTSLEAGDILFIDSTHVLRPGGDVQWEYCEILPRLAPGVLVHIHDISLPKPYFATYFEQHLYWNEQYLLQAFLAFNSRFEVVWPGTFLFLRHLEVMHAMFPEISAMRKVYPLAEPSSFWMRVRS